jgi:hypothetical protein
MAKRILLRRSPLSSELDYLPSEWRGNIHLQFLAFSQENNVSQLACVLVKHVDNAVSIEGEKSMIFVRKTGSAQVHERAGTPTPMPLKLIRTIYDCFHCVARVSHRNAVSYRSLPHTLDDDGNPLADADRVAKEGHAHRPLLSSTARSRSVGSCFSLNLATRCVGVCGSASTWVRKRGRLDGARCSAQQAAISSAARTSPGRGDCS